MYPSRSEGKRVKRWSVRPHRRRVAAARAAARANQPQDEDQVGLTAPFPVPLQAKREAEAVCERRRRVGRCHARMGPSRPDRVSHRHTRRPGWSNRAPRLTLVAAGSTDMGDARPTKSWRWCATGATTREGAAAIQNVRREAQTGGGGLHSVLSLLFPTLHTMYTVRRVAAALDQVLRTLCPRL